MYNDIDDIIAKKAELQKAINRKEKEISILWEDVFHPKEDKTFSTPSQRLLKYANTGLGLMDGALLGWKLYRKLRK
ncbi:hypothetical protein HPS57_01250 [Prevotella sp. PINT]|jgi:hypothetical protein|uniref:hypothetical protein n=1 Tax=Palleniella intestinalis TaxID=2736291 RepID=UPI001556DDBB|nr:hypothetical protein [Palleniella intestinalis]NPD80612.1 hypothetical protein [Palleniella intestinalis]